MIVTFSLAWHSPKQCTDLFVCLICLCDSHVFVNGAMRFVGLKRKIESGIDLPTVDKKHNRKGDTESSLVTTEGSVTDVARPAMMNGKILFTNTNAVGRGTVPNGPYKLLGISVDARCLIAEDDPPDFDVLLCVENSNRERWLWTASLRSSDTGYHVNQVGEFSFVN